MAKLRLPQNSFANGILVEDRLRGRYDLKQYLAGARELHNVNSHPQGGVYRRPGSIYMDDYTSKGTKFKIVPFDYSDSIAYLLVFYAGFIDVWRDNVLVHTITATAITDTILTQMDYVQRANVLIMVHDILAPTQLSRGANDTTWTLGSITFDSLPLFAFTPVVTTPAGTVTPSAVSGNIKLTSSSSNFSAADVGGYVTGNGGEARITGFVSSSVVNARVTLNFVDDTAIASGSWSKESGYEATWSSGKGYPRSVIYSNDSLIFGGTRVLPDVFWKSAIGRYFTFDDTQAKSDGALTSNIRSNNINDIRFMVDGNDLLFLTSKGEFYVDGDLTPDLEFKIRKQEARGVRQYIKPVFVDGAPVYIDARADVLRELTYSDVDAKYSSTNLTLFCPGLLVDPKHLAHQQPQGQRDNDYVWIINGDGSWVVFNTLRKQDINGFTTGKSREDKMLYCENLNGVLYAMFERSINGETRYYLERFDSSVRMDCCKVYSGEDTNSIDGLDHLEGENVKIVTNGFIYGPDTVDETGEIELNGNYGDIVVGLPFTVRVKTLPPPANLPDGTAVGQIRRMVSVNLGLTETGEFTVNDQPVRTRRFGNPIFDAPAAVLDGRKLVSLRGGYNRDPIIEIVQEEPLPFHLTDYILEVSV